MSIKEPKLEVWTEGLGTFWGIAPDYVERIEREPMLPEELLEIILKIIDENDADANGLFMLKFNKKQVNLRLNAGKLEVSDPSNLNYQNVALKTEELVSYLNEFFGIGPKKEEIAKNTHVRLLEGIIAVIVAMGMVGTFYYVSKYLERTSEFFPEPDTIEFGNAEDRRTQLEDLSGIYMTGLDNGETLIEIKPDGNWAFYDLEATTGNYFTVQLVDSGQCRPAFESGQLALVTDLRYVFYAKGNGKLIFQDREYILSTKSRDEIPFVRFVD